MPAPDRYRLGPLLLDLRAGRLLDRGEPVDVQQKVIDLLAAMVSRPGALWSREALMATVWPDTFVSDDALFQVIRRARRVLADAAQPRIETVRGKGYRLVGDVVPVTPPDAEVILASDTFVARGPELSELDQRWERGDRLVALAGPGGAGKTRLATEHLERAERWAWHAAIDLTATRTTAEVVAAVAAALGVPLERARDDGRGRVGAAIDARGPGLLLLDNTEQLMPDLTGLLDAWTAAAPEARWLLTTRDRTGLDPARTLTVPSLGVSDGRTLFRDRARGAGVDLEPHWDPDIDALVADLEGSPLAIELAAARTRLLSPRAIRDRLGEVLGSFGGRGHHGSVRATVEWSWRLLEPPERSVLAQIAVFADTFTIDLAEQVVQVDGALLVVLDALEKQSLLEGPRAQAVPEAGRLRLPVTVREFAREHSAIVPGLQDRFVDAMRAIALEAWPLVFQRDIALWRRLYREEHNLAEALRLAPDDPRAAEIALGLGMLWVLDGRHDEAIALVTPWLADPELPDALRDRLVAVVADAERLSPTDASSEARPREAARRAEARGEPRLADLLSYLAARQLRSRSALDEAVEVFRGVHRRALDRGDLSLATRAVTELAPTAHGASVPGIRALLEDALARCTPGVDDAARADLLDAMGYAAAYRGDIDEADGLYAEAFALAEHHCPPLRRLAMRQNAAVGLMAGGRFEAAEALQTEVLDRSEAMGFAELLTIHHTNRAHTRMHLDDLSGAQSDLLRARGNARSQADELMADLNRVSLQCLQGRFDEAAERATACLEALPDEALVMRTDLWIWQAIAEAGRGGRAEAEALVEAVDAVPVDQVPAPVREPVAAVRALLAGDDATLAALESSDAPSTALTARAARRALRASAE